MGVSTLSQYHAQLAYCVVQFIEKDPSLSSEIVGGLLRFWPIISCSKELLFLSELEEVLEMTEQPQFEKLIVPVFKRIAACICSPHFQVAERALFLWNNDVIAQFMSDHRPVILPVLYPALHVNLERHWNNTVTQLTTHIMQQFMDMDEKLFKKVEAKYKETHKPAEKARQRTAKWNKVTRIGMQNKKNNHYNISSSTNNMQQKPISTQKHQFEKLIVPVFKRIAACICSPHFQVAERALFLWNNDVIAQFMSDHRPVILPVLYPALHVNLE